MDFPGGTVDEASQVAELGKNQPAVQETPVLFLGQEVPLEKGQAAQYSCACLVAQMVKNPPTMWGTRV